MQTDHFMIDIETYDTKPTAVILSIGAVQISEQTEEANKFYVEVNINTQYERTMSIDTKNWWAKQGNPPINGTTSLFKGLSDLGTFIRQRADNPIIWCKGTDFDVVILAHAYNQLHLPVPWKYNNVRDCRTVFKIAGFVSRDATHNALDDAVRQTENLCTVMTYLGGSWG